MRHQPANIPRLYSIELNRCNCLLPCCSQRLFTLKMDSSMQIMHWPSFKPRHQAPEMNYRHLPDGIKSCSHSVQTKLQFQWHASALARTKPANCSKSWNRQVPTDRTRLFGMEPQLCCIQAVSWNLGGEPVRLLLHPW